MAVCECTVNYLYPSDMYETICTRYTYLWHRHLSKCQYVKLLQFLIGFIHILLHIFHIWVFNTRIHTCTYIYLTFAYLNNEGEHILL